MRWKTIPGFSYYQASACGQIRRDPSKRMRGWGPRRLPGQLLKPCYHDYVDKYLVVRMKDDEGINRVVRVHQIVCRTFNGRKPSPDHCACHKNDERHDNCADNLYWGTKKQNAIDRERNQSSGTACLNSAEVRWVKELYFGDAWRIKELSELFVVKPHVIRGIVTGKSYKWVTNKWGDPHAV